MNPQIEQYITIPSRNKIVVSNILLPDFGYTDLGKELCESLKDCVHDRMLVMIANDKLNAILDQSIQSYEGYGNVLAITNIGVLFEPTLQINVRNLIEQKSKDCLLVIQSECEVAMNRFYFMSSKYNVGFDLSGLSYIVITEN